MYGYLKLKVNPLQWRLQFLFIIDKKKVVRISDSPCSKHPKIVKIILCELQLEKFDTDFSLCDTKNKITYIFRASSAEVCGMWFAHLKMLKQGIDPAQFMAMTKRIRFNPAITTLPFAVLQKLKAAEDAEADERGRFASIEHQVRSEILLELSDCVYLTQRTERKMQLVEMGFGCDLSADSLVHTSGDVQAAVDMLALGETGALAYRGLHTKLLKLLRMGYRGRDAEAALQACNGDLDRAESRLKDMLSDTQSPRHTLDDPVQGIDSPVGPALKRVSLVGDVPRFDDRAAPGEGAAQAAGAPAPPGDIVHYAGSFLELHETLSPHKVHSKGAAAAPPPSLSPSLSGPGGDGVSPSSGVAGATAAAAADAAPADQQDPAEVAGEEDALSSSALLARINADASEQLPKSPVRRELSPDGEQGAAAAAVEEEAEEEVEACPVVAAAGGVEGEGAAGDCDGGSADSIPYMGQEVGVSAEVGEPAGGVQEGGAEAAAEEEEEEPRPEVGGVVEPEAVAPPQPEAEEVAVAAAVAEPQPESAAELQPEAAPESQPEAGADAAVAESQPEAKTVEAGVEDEVAEPQPEAEADVAAELQAEAAVEPQPEPEAAAVAEAQPEPVAEPQPEPEAVAKSVTEAQPEAVAVPQPEPEAAAVAEAQPEPEAVAVVEADGETVAEPQPAAETVAEPEANAEAEEPEAAVAAADADADTNTNTAAPGTGVSDAAGDGEPAAAPAADAAAPQATPQPLEGESADATAEPTPAPAAVAPTTAGGEASPSPTTPPADEASPAVSTTASPEGGEDPAPLADTPAPEAPAPSES